MENLCQKRDKMVARSLLDRDLLDLLDYPDGWSR